MKMHRPSSFTAYPADRVCSGVTMLHAGNGQPHSNPFIYTEMSTLQAHLYTYGRNRIFVCFFNLKRERNPPKTFSSSYLKIPHCLQLFCKHKFTLLFEESTLP